MSESKVVYVNEDSDDESELIFGAVQKPPETKPVEKIISPEPEPTDVEDEESEQTGGEEPEEPSEYEKLEKFEQAGDEEHEEHKDVIDDDEASIIGGEGYKSEPDDTSSVSSLDTDAILNVDPLYFRLTKFLQTGGSEPENVAEILKKINTNLELMNQNLMKLMTAKSTH